MQLSTLIDVSASRWKCSCRWMYLLIVLTRKAELLTWSTTQKRTLITLKSSSFVELTSTTWTTLGSSLSSTHLLDVTKQKLHAWWRMELKLIKLITREGICSITLWICLLLQLMLPLKLNSNSLTWVSILTSKIITREYLSTMLSSRSRTGRINPNSILSRLSLVFVDSLVCWSMRRMSGKRLPYITPHREDLLFLHFTSWLEVLN